MDPITYWFERAGVRTGLPELSQSLGDILQTPQHLINSSDGMIDHVFPRARFDSSG